MRYAIHQVLINRTSDAVLSLIRSAAFAAILLMVVNRNTAAYRAVDQLLCLMNAICDRDLDHRFSVETRHADILVRGHDDSLSRVNLGLCQHVLGTTGSVSLHLNGNSKLLCHIFQVLGSHIGVGNAGRTGGNCQNTITCSFLFFFVFFLFLCTKFCGLRIINHL